MFGGFLGAYIYADFYIWGGKNDRNLSYYCVLPQKKSNKWVTGCVVGTLRVHKQSQNSDIGESLREMRKIDPWGMETWKVKANENAGDI